MNKPKNNIDISKIKLFYKDPPGAGPDSILKKLVELWNEYVFNEKKEENKEKSNETRSQV